MRFGSIHEAVSEAFRLFQERTGLNAIQYIVEHSDFMGSTVYQWKEAVGDGEAARRNISLVNAVMVTNILNQGYADRGLPKDFTILHAACGATGAILVAPPAGVNVENVGIPRTLNEFNEFVQALVESLRDGAVNGGNLQRIRKEAYELIAVVMAQVEEAARRERAQA